MTSAAPYAAPAEPGGEVLLGFADGSVVTLGPADARGRALRRLADELLARR